MPVKTWYIVVTETGQIINAVTCESQDLAQKALDRHAYPRGLQLVPEHQASREQIQAYRLAQADELTREGQRLGLYEE